METKEELRAALAIALSEAQAAKQRVDILLRERDMSHEINTLHAVIEQFRQIAPAGAKEMQESSQ